MDLKNLQTYANAISASSSLIKRYALEQVRISKDHERRLKEIGSVVLPSALDPAKPYGMDELRAHVVALDKAVRAIRTVK